jgi:hypothetical protein
VSKAKVVKIAEPLHRRFKTEVARQGRTMREVFEMLVYRWLAAQAAEEEERQSDTAQG